MVNREKDLRKAKCAPSSVQQRIIRSRLPASATHTTLLAYLTERFTYFDEITWLDHLKAGRLQVDGKPVRPDQPYAPGSLLEFHPPELAEPPVATNWRVIYEDDELLIVDKPAPLPSHPSGSYFNNSLLRLMEQQYGLLHIITRLDRETAGLCLLAKNQPGAKRLHECQKDNLIDKGYLALVHGRFPVEKVSAAGCLYADSNSQVRKKRRFGYTPPDGLAAESCRSDFRLISSQLSPAGWLSLVEATLYTGRTHQIRASLYSLGFPLVGDKLYGLDDGCFIRFCENRQTEADRQTLLLPNQALVCHRLGLPDSRGQPIRVQRPVSFTIGNTSFDSLPQTKTP